MRCEPASTPILTITFITDIVSKTFFGVLEKKSCSRTGVEGLSVEFGFFICYAEG